MPRRVFLVAIALHALTSACGSRNNQTPEPNTDANRHVSPCGAGEAICPLDHCRSGSCSLVELSAVPTPSVFGVDQDYVYFSGNQLALYRTPKCGGPTETIALSASPFHGPKLSGEFVYYWLGMGPIEVRRMPKNGGASEPLTPQGASAPQGPAGIQLVGDELYLDDGYGIAVMPAAGGALTRVYDHRNIVAMVGDGRSVYFCAEEPPWGLLRITNAQRPAELMVALEITASGRPSAPAVNGDAVFVAYQDRNDLGTYLNRVDKASKRSSRMIAMETVPYLLSADDRCIYSFVQGDTGSPLAGGLSRIPIDGGDVEYLASTANGIALDDGAYYFASGSHVFRRPK